MKNIFKEKRIGVKALIYVYLNSPRNMWIGKIGRGIESNSGVLFKNIYHLQELGLIEVNEDGRRKLVIITKRGTQVAELLLKIRELTDDKLV